MDITCNTRTTVAVTLQKIYDALGCDQHRDLFREKVDEFVKWVIFSVVFTRIAYKMTEFYFIYHYLRLERS